MAGDRMAVEAGGLAAEQFPLAGKATFLDNAPTMGMTARPRSLAGKLEFLLISIGMSVFAYLLEKMILRSARGGRTNP